MSASEVGQLTEQLASLAREIARLLLRPRYDEAELAELEVRATELRARIRAAQAPDPVCLVELRRPGVESPWLLSGGG